MFLKELELVGFKSFPEKTRLKFEPGITAIVGPNGCGKSNIFDGIRWVLGEQSTKALRSLNMEDVIFNGSDKKTSVGMAEVTLIFSNTSRRLGVDSDEIEISRRIFRSGESEYLLNKTPVRLKDILDIFMGTGIGAESYSLVEQGRIGLILSSRPEERRLIFDEASGITKYKTQKKEAMRKLEETEQNLLRINDIITEVKREINSLERQANKARRYKEIFEELKNEETNLASLEIIDIDKQKEGIVNKMNNLEHSISSFQGESQGVQKQISQKASQIQLLEKDISDYHDRLLNIDNLISNNTQRIQINKERVAELNSRIVNSKNQLKEAESRIETAKKNLENFHKEYSELENRVKQQEALLLNKQQEYEEANSSIKSSQEKMKHTKNRILELVTTNSQLKNDLADLQAHLKSQILRKKRLDIEKIKTKEEKESLGQILNQHKSELDNIRHELGRIDSGRMQVRERLAGEVNIEKSLTSEIQKLEDERIALQSQKEFLEELRLKYEGISQSLNAVIYLDQAPRDSISGILIKVKNSPQAVSEGIKTCPPGFRFKLSGEAKSMPLETEAIGRMIEKIKLEINKKQESKKIVQNAINELSQQLADLDQKAKAQEILISNKSIQVDNLNEQLNKINQEYEVVNLELDDLEKQIEQLNNKQADSEARLLQTTQEQKKEEAAVNQLENAVIEFRSLRESALVDITQIKAEIENQNVRLAQQDNTKVILENASNESRQFYQRNLDEIQESEFRIKQLQDEEGELIQQNKEADKDKVNVCEREKRQQTELGQLSKLKGEDDNKILQLNQNIEDLRKQTYEYQMQVQELDFKQRSIRDRINQVYKIDLGDVPLFKEIQDRETLAVKISEFKKRLDSLGTVNLIAIEEYEELKKRYDFLNQQQTDLSESKNSLNEAINKINRTTRQMFLDTFKKIQIEFRNYFRLLFGGGEAEIVLTDETDPLESGIEIICQPPGKKLQNVLALSGGEKSLSAVALIFAIFKVNPAPFCVLDEVDAALDEANIDRFSGILQEFAKQSQFLVITHNKKTIVNADVMYGITMQEPGVSKIVSVKFS